VTQAAALVAVGERVSVRPIRRDDVEPYRTAVEMSRDRLARWNPVGADDILRQLT
jgi:ribosomal-protein-alanine N-acetyltransferase